MASTSFAFPNQFTGGRFSAAPPQLNLRRTLRVSAGYATAERSAAGEIGNSYSQTASFYDVLGIQTSATSQEIKSAYRNLARTVHPDVASNYGGGESRSSSAADEFIRVHAAYATLSDPEKRAVYDSSLFRMRRRTVVSMGGGGGGGYSEMSRGRRWETDQCW